MNQQLADLLSQALALVMNHLEEVIVFTIALLLVVFVGAILWLRKRILSQIRIYKIESWSNEPQSHLSLTKTTMDNMGLKTSWTGLSPHFTQNGKDQFQPYEMHRGQFPEWPKPTTQWKNENDEKFVLGRKKAPLLPRKLFITFGIFALLALITLFVWRVGIPAIANWLTEREQTTEVVVAPVPPTMPAPLSCDEAGSCIEQGVDVDPTPESDVESVKKADFESSTLVIDLDQSASRTPSALEEQLSIWLNNLPTGPATEIPILDSLISLLEEIFNSGGTATIISIGEDGFVLVTAWPGSRLEYQYLNENLEWIGDSIEVYGTCGTVKAGQGDAKLLWGVCYKDHEWSVSSRGKGNYDVVVYDGGLVVDTKGIWVRWTPLWLFALLPLAAIGLIWLRRR